ncbi:MAG TPA: non-canonical purine NTP diphosphatase [Bacteroidales bacterium]|nr:non-canonical purine NTP diphosphatase [Bacteroidales bacterium]
MKLVFATNNAHKLNEIRNLAGSNFEIVSLSDMGWVDEIPETGKTIEDNASQKAFYIYEKYKFDCFADDTGLEIEALDKRPGVYSARYAGESCNFEDNMSKVLTELQGITNRKACFRTVISLVIQGKEVRFEGRVDGVILNEYRGNKGFGYDPIFQPNGYKQTFAEMPLELKNAISHRGLATQKLITFLKNLK